VTAGLFIGGLTAVAVYLLLWHTTWGLEQRLAGQAPRFALSAGITPRLPVIRAVMLSGALAGLAGALEVLGVHYHYVNSFTGGDAFDSLAVAFLGQLHPAGIALFSVLLGGLRAGAITGLQIQSGVPREIGGFLIAVMLIAASVGRSTSASTRPPDA
jgi:simple sugar transport system permease protein